MIIKRIGVVKAGVIQACVMALFGLLAGLFMLLFGSMAGGLMGAAGGEGATGLGLGMIGGIGAVIFFPIMYGIFGFIAGVIGAAIYNLVARYVGGLELDVE
ncbi:MAG: hypothetical protein EOP90_09280 [Lysobacteraceae bacterium]|nr:MAG: hypothetical protein EOP90_09280 [Xanthomonadaceae bacterium]